MAGPSLEDYTLFLRDVVGITTDNLPDGDPVIEWSYNFGLNIVTPLLNVIPQLPEQFLYTSALYNFATHMLIEWAQDQPGSDFFSKMQKKYNLHSLVAGAVEAASDENTSTKLKLPAFFEGMTFLNLDLMKTPWGRKYLQIVQSLGSLSLMNIA